MRSSCKHHPLDACMHRVASTRTNIKSNTLKLQFYCRVRWFYKQSCTQCCTCYTVKYWPASERKLFNEYIEHFGGNVEHAAKNQHHRTDCSSIYFVFREEAVKNKLSLENRIVEFIWNAHKCRSARQWTYASQLQYNYSILCICIRRVHCTIVNVKR